VSVLRGTKLVKIPSDIGMMVCTRLKKCAQFFCFWYDVAADDMSRLGSKRV
jgi:hypothetical protein